LLYYIQIERGGENMTRAQIGKRLQALRGNRTMDEVANAIGITRQAVSHYEAGRRTPKDEIKIAIAKYYGKTVQDIFFAD